MPWSILFSVQSSFTKNTVTYLLVITRIIYQLCNYGNYNDQVNTPTMLKAKIVKKKGLFVLISGIKEYLM